MSTHPAAVAAQGTHPAGIGGAPDFDAELFAAIVGASRQGIAIIDPESQTLVFANRRLAMLAGCNADQLTGRSIESCLLDDPAAMEPLHDAMNTGKTARVQLRGCDASGGIAAQSVHLAPLGGTGHYVMTVDDNTDEVTALDTLESFRTELAETRARLQDLTQKDPVTCVFNRRYFEQEFARQHAMCVRDTRAMSLLIIDVDNFSGFNAQQGESASDGCLERVAQTVAAKLRRAGEFVARYDESRFVAVVGGNAQQTEPLAEAIRAGVCNLEIAHPASMTSSVVSVSIGVASETPDRDCDPKRLLARAEAALGEAQHCGKNTVRFA